MSIVSSRREEVLMSARAVIIRDGLEATSLRRIAREGGFSTGVLTHYFLDKDELITACFSWTINEWLGRVEGELLDAPTAEEMLARFVLISLPHDEPRHGEWRLWLNFVVTAAGNPQLATLLVDVDRRWEGLVEVCFQRCHEAGLLVSTIPFAQQAQIFARLSDGLGLRALVTNDWTEARSQFVAALSAIGLAEDVAQRLMCVPLNSEDEH